MDSAVLGRLEHSSANTRCRALKELRANVKEKGHLMIANVKNLFLILKDRIVDVDGEVIMIHNTFNVFFTSLIVILFL